ncbi:hypothetical protein E2C01_086770 [Portunus trituberculatus]|uniref:Uncharacterized protein n=1 Tax=Portunus trituberculatus TaxID=210409 RepID=A0A5B7JH96_PORTR|nr:hypothetical protein [Portunus trituberculatus]
MVSHMHAHSLLLGTARR